MSRICLLEPAGLEVPWRSLGVFGGTVVRVQFGDFVFDSDTRELLREREPAHLSPKAFRVLELLLEHRPRALSKDELHRQVWPKTFVSEATLASAIAEIRAAVGDTGTKPLYLRTVHGFGYAFSGPVTESKPPAAVGTPGILVWGDRDIPLHTGDSLLGRGDDVAVGVNDNSVSRHHARIAIRADSVTLEDLESKNGTFVGALRITQPTRLRDGDEIRLGDIVLTFQLVDSAASTRTVKDQRPGSARAEPAGDLASSDPPAPASRRPLRLSRRRE